MAHASEPALDGLTPADFVHRKSAVHYRIYAEDGKVCLSFRRPNDPSVRSRAPVALLQWLGTARPNLFCSLEFNPDLAEAKILFQHLNDAAPKCNE
jgi:hypothetical protein